MLRPVIRRKVETLLTPIKYINALGGADSFDLDPAYLPDLLKPWETSKESFSKEDNGLKKMWFGRVWLNPPEEKTNDSSIFDWVKAMADHNNGIMLINSNTDTAYWQDQIFTKASAILFVRGRIQFLNVNGKGITNERNQMVINRNPSAFIAYGDNNMLMLKRANDRGAINGRLIIL